MSINETATTTVYLDGQQAESQLKELQRELDKVRDKMQKAFAANDLKEMKKLETQQKSLTREMQSFRKVTFDADRVLKNLSGSTLNDLYKTKRKLSSEIRNLTRDTKQYANTSKDLRRVEQEIKKVQTQMGRARTVSLSLKSAFSMLAPARLIYSSHCRNRPAY
jgi:DNA repair exonuclease SbcCD ATPase subunit